jgi:hypothetical protein
MTQKINPSEFAIVINEGNIIIIASNRSRSRIPYIKKIRSKGLVDTLVDLE